MVHKLAGRARAVLWESSSIMVRMGYKPLSGLEHRLITAGVDAVNTTLEVLLFAATMNLGQSWKTVLTLFACKKSNQMKGCLPS